MREADWAGVEQNADNAGGLTLDTLRAEAFIDRARMAPNPSCKRPSRQRQATNLLTFDSSNQDRSAFSLVQAAGPSRALAVAAYCSTSASDSTRSKPSAERSRVAGTMATPWARRPPPWTWA